MADPVQPGPLPDGLKEVAPKGPAPLPGRWQEIGAPEAEPERMPLVSPRAAANLNLPQQEPSASEGLYRSWKENELAAIQGVSPHATSKYFGSSQNMKPQMLGFMEEFDNGPMYKGPSGEYLHINPKHDFVARDPQSGRMAVYSRTPETDEKWYESLARLVTPMLGTGPMVGPHRAASAVPAAERAAQPVTTSAQKAADIQRDIAAFKAHDVPTPPIAFMEGPMSGVGKMLSKIPYVGTPIDRSLENAHVATVDAIKNLSSRMGPNATMEQTGARIQSGLDRARNARLADLEPHVLANLGIEPRAPVPPTSFMSEGAAERAAEAAAIRRSMEEAGYAPSVSARPLDQVYTARRSVSDLGDAELRAILNQPSSETSFATRSEALYENAWRSIPTLMRENNTVNPTRLAAPNTRATLNGIDQSITNSIAGQRTINGDLAERIMNPRAHFGLDDLRAIRTEVGRSLSNFSPLQNSLDRGQLKQLYGSLSRDIEIGLQDIANRAYQRTQISNNRPDYVAPEVARTADEALRRFRVADRYFRQGVERMDRFSKIAGTDNPQQAVGFMINAATEGKTGNERMLRAAMGNLRPEERNQLSALLVQELGRPNPSAGGIVEKYGFSPQSFMTKWNKMSPQARDLLFGGEYAREMDNLVRVVNRLSNVEKLANTSKSGTDIINFLTGIGSVGLAMNGHTAALGAVAGPMVGMSVLFSRPSYVHWVSKYAQARAALADASASVQAPRMTALVNQLGQLARQDERLLPVFRQIAAENGVGDRRNEKKPVE